MTKDEGVGLISCRKCHALKAASSKFNQDLAFYISVVLSGPNDLYVSKTVYITKVPPWKIVYLYQRTDPAAIIKTVMYSFQESYPQ